MPPHEATAPLGSLQSRVRSWLLDEVAQSNRSSARSDGRCPFVGPADRAGVIRYERTISSRPAVLGELVAVVNHAIANFEARFDSDASRHLQCLMLVFDGLDDGSAELLFEVQSQAMAAAASRRLILGAFAPSGSPPGCAPVPLIAIRRMTVQDVVFVDDRESSFANYHEAFGHRFESPIGMDPALTAAYAKAATRIRDRLADQ